jgi:glutathione-specific gamma-glutamylcyclotransferase
MWVFGYGSLMWDGWEIDRGCLRRMTGELRGYVRRFNKLSVRNWGTRPYPGPTLNLVASNSSCRGIVFEFPESRRAEIMAYLVQREGENFTLSERPIVLGGGAAVAALPLYHATSASTAMPVI